jgi:hypothetical protein
MQWQCQSCNGQVTPEIREQIASVQAVSGAVALAGNHLETQKSYHH